MRRWLCTVEPVPDRPDIAWMILPDDPTAGSTPALGRKAVGDGVTMLSIDGERVEPHRRGVTPLATVGSFETPAEMIDLILPRIVRDAKKKLSGEFPPGILMDVSVKAIDREPWTNSLWVLKAHPRELESWADTLARKP